MKNDNKFKQDPNKKSFPTTFLFLLFGVALLVLTVQNFMSTKQAKVAFSHQLEHLVNLDLLIPEDSRKVSLNDNLVTFSGKFRDKETDEGKKHFRFLELLETNQKLKNEKAETGASLDLLGHKIQESGAWFLQLSGLGLPQNGYRIITDQYNSPDRNNTIIIRELPKREVLSLVDIEKRYNELQVKAASSSIDEQIVPFSAHLLNLIEQFRSPLLGVGAENLKQELKSIEKQVQDASYLPAKDQLAVYGAALNALSQVVTQLDQPIDNIHLNDLRYVRQYKDELKKYNELNSALEQNEVQLEKARLAVGNVIWYFNNKELSSKALEKQDPEIFNHWYNGAKQEWNNFATNKGLSFKAPDQPRNLVLEKTFKSEEPAPNYFSYIFTVLPIILIVLLLYFVFSRQMKGMGGGAMNFGKSPAKLLQKGQHKVTFKDVAGIEEAKEELVEIVEFLKNPSKFTALGGRIPKGVLCIGPPGTGKTLIAKAVAGEADRPFFSIAGSDFVEMFVGVGASRIRDMFDQAKKNAPCIIFIDEIDAVGRHRGAGFGGGHDEREQTLNQLLVEMDGFDTSEGVILMAATNRPDILDKALLRPGRFDRRVVIGLPDVKGRYEILKVHARKIKIDPAVDLMATARSTPGSSGADLENILNEAALLAARKSRSAVTAQEVIEARDKVLYGKERRSLELDENQKRTTAYHEAGHAIVGLHVEHADPVDKVTIIPRGLSLGATHFLPEKNRVGYWKKEVLDQLAVLMGGRCAEEIFIGDISSGAQQDISQATRFARSMICAWGMSDQLGTVTYDDMSEGAGGYNGAPAERSYSEETAKAIDDEVRTTLEEAHARAKEIITSHKEQVELMAQMLMEFETLDAQDVKEIFNRTWDIEKKRARLQVANHSHMQGPAAGTNLLPPPPPSGGQELGIVGA